MIAMGAGDLFTAWTRFAPYEYRISGHKHASLYDVSLIEPLVKKTMLEKGIEIKMQHRATEWLRVQTIRALT